MSGKPAGQPCRQQALASTRASARRGPLQHASPRQHQRPCMLVLTMRLVRRACRTAARGACPRCAWGRARSCWVSVLSGGRMCSDLLTARGSPIAATVYLAMSSSVLITPARRAPHARAPRTARAAERPAAVWRRAHACALRKRENRRGAAASAPTQQRLMLQRTGPLRRAARPALRRQAGAAGGGARAHRACGRRRRR